MATANGIFSTHEISLTEVLPLRSSLFRAGQSPDNCRFIQDGCLPALHYGLKEKGALIAVASFYNRSLPKERNCPQGPQIDNLEGCQLRGMAVEASRQKNGFGRALLEQAERDLQNKWQPAPGYIWCYSELEAIGFYERVGFTKIGDCFDLESVGRLQTMIRVCE